jgi:predicted  nucleic acid-binding Zn ribbon protein
MNAHKINFISKANIEFNDDTLEQIWDYLGCLNKNGQILENYELIESKEGLWALVTLPDDDALKTENNNIYVNKYLNTVQEHFIVSSEPIGKNMNQDKSCDCKEPSWYMLYTDWTLSESPVVCGDCGKTVPLYRLPHIMNSDEHYGVLGWQGAYKSTDALWIYCLSDRFTFRQMHDPQSQLSKCGMDICKAFEEKLGKPFFYYLYNNNRTNKTCPVCGGNWKIHGEKTFVDYKCEKCRLVADETSKYGVKIDS